MMLHCRDLDYSDMLAATCSCVSAQPVPLEWLSCNSVSIFAEKEAARAAFSDGTRRGLFYFLFLFLFFIFSFVALEQLFQFEPETVLRYLFSFFRVAAI